MHKTLDGSRQLPAWVLDHIGQPLTVAVLARKMNMSGRNLTRHFIAATGTTPLQWLLTQRIHRAQELLGSTDASMGPYSAARPPHADHEFISLDRGDDRFTQLGVPLTNVSPGLNERVHPQVSWGFLQSIAAWALFSLDGGGSIAFRWPRGRRQDLA